MNGGCVKNFTTPSFILAEKLAVKERYGRVGTGWFTVLNDSASPKRVMQIYFNLFSIFLKVLELFECRRGKPKYDC